MDEKNLDSGLKSPADADVSAGESTMLSKDEQHLAKLGYKQGTSASDLGCMIKIWGILTEKSIDRILPPPRAVRELGRNVHHDELRLGHPDSLWFRHVHGWSSGLFCQLDLGWWVCIQHGGLDLILALTSAPLLLYNQ